MRKLLFIVVLLLSTNLLAEVFNCEMNIKSSTFGDQKYSLLVDIGKETELALTTADIETGKFAGNIASTVYNIGKIYLNEGHPYGFGKIDREELTNSKFLFSRNWDMLNTYIRDHVNVEHHINLINKQTWGNSYKPNHLFLLHFVKFVQQLM